MYVLCQIYNSIYSFEISYSQGSLSLSLIFQILFYIGTVHVYISVSTWIVLWFKFNDTIFFLCNLIILVCKYTAYYCVEFFPKTQSTLVVNFFKLVSKIFLKLYLFNNDSNNLPKKLYLKCERIETSKYFLLF